MPLRCITLAASLSGFLPQSITGVLLRAANDDAIAGSPGNGPATKVERLLLDIDESVRKSGTDAEFVYATLYSYDHQLDATLSDEMDRVSKDFAKLKDFQKQYQQTVVHAASAEHSSGSKGGNRSAKAGVTLSQKGREAQILKGASAEFRSAMEAVQQQTARVQLSTTGQNGTIARGVPANLDELSFSTTFTEAVLRIDRDFTFKVRESMKKKAELVEMIRNTRQTQHKTLESLIDLLRGRYKVNNTGAPDAAAGDDAAMLAGPAFLQTSAHSKDPEQPPRQQKVSNLQYQIEAALKKKEDTHGILMRIKEVLDKTAPVNADSVQGLMSELGGVLRSVNVEQSHSDQAKAKCTSQSKHANLEEQGLRANMALMDVVHNHTQAAIQAAKYNLQRIVTKTKDLQLSTEEFSKIVSKTTATLEDQSQDRRTIMAAVEKAREIVSHVDSGGPAASALLEQMLKDLQAQEVGERTYRATEVAFRQSFLAYAGSYLQLLRESRGHYESSLSALELYAEEVESDTVAQADSLASGKELQKESEDLCAGILRFYGHHKRRRDDLRHALQAVLPEVPAVLAGSAGPSGSDAQSTA